MTYYGTTEGLFEDYIKGRVEYITIASKLWKSEDGKPDITKMNLITFDPIHNGYVQLGERVGNAFADGKKLYLLKN